MPHRLIQKGSLVLLAAYAASATAEHYGRVLFNGLPVPGATVTATRGQQKLTTVTDTQGIYHFAEMKDGEWTVRVELHGFAPAEQTVKPDAASNTVLAVEMKMLPLADVLAGSHPMEAGTVMAAKPVPLPEEKKDEKKPAAQTADAGTPPPPPPQDAGADGMLINGSENNAATSKYSISPAFGTRRAGTKALYNGSAGVQFANSALDARPYSITGFQVPKASYSRFTGVATLGGPIRIPHWFYNGPTFFVGYQWTRDRNANTISGLVPTLAQRNGDLSGTLTAQGQPVTVIDPATGKPIAGAVPVSPQARALLALYPLPNLAGNTQYNYQTQVLTSEHIDAMQSRLNKGVGRRDQFFGGFAFQSVRSNTENLFHFRDTTNTLGIDSNVHWQHRLPHQVMVDIGYRFTRFRTLTNPYFANVTNISGAAGITGNEQSAVNWGPPALTFSSGIATLSDAISAFNRNRTDQLAISADWTHRKHTVTFGGDFRRQEYNQLSQANPRGSFTFTGAATQSATANTTGSDLADFLLGVPDTSAVAFGNADKYFRQSVSDLFVTDDWRLRPELTLNTGVRWDYGAPISELYGRLVNLDIAQNFSAVAPVLGNSPKGPLTGLNYPKSLVKPDRTKFQPRVGLSWRPLPTSPLVIRAGYGIYVDTSVYLPSAQSMSQQAPLSTSLTVSNSASCALTLANGFRNCAGTTPNTFAIDPNFRVGYAQTWRVSAQQDLPGSLVMTATYLGTKGANGPQEILPNTYAPGATAICAACPRGFVYRQSNGQSIRHSGEVQLRRRLRSGFTATLDYVYAHSIDNDSTLGGTGYVSSSTPTTSSSFSAAAIPRESIAQNWLDLRAERSRSSFDQRHLLKLNFQYTSGQGLTGGSLWQGWRGTLLKRWTISGQLSAGSGLPQTPVYLAAVPGTGFTGTLRPNRTAASVTGNTAPGYRLNAAAYAAPAAGVFGNAGRYSIEGPGAISFDSSIARVFKLRDPFNLDVRVDASNVLNHPVYTGWNTITNSTTFGLPASSKDMRTLQISGRLRF